MDHALKTGCPIVGINDVAAPASRGRWSRSACSRDLLPTVMASGVTPQISLIMGPCAGGAVYSRPSPTSP